MAENQHLLYVAASYTVTFAVLALVILASLSRWRQVQKKLKEQDHAKEA